MVVTMHNKSKFVEESSDVSQDMESDEAEMSNNDEEDISDCDEEGTSNNEESKPSANLGWADAMQKILKSNKPGKKKTLVLSRAKKLCDIVNKESVDIEKNESTEVTLKKDVEESKISRKVKKRDTKQGIRVKPTVLDRDREKMLQKIATKGVVQLFNAVRQQQMRIDERLTQAGPLERKREQVLKSIDKRAFLDVLMGDSKSVPVDTTTVDKKQKEANNEDKKDQVWSVLRDDFVMGAKLKDWDKEEQEEQEEETENDANDSNMSDTE